MELQLVRSERNYLYFYLCRQDESYFIVCVFSLVFFYLLSSILVPYSTGISPPPLQASATFVEKPIKKNKAKNFIFWPLEKGKFI